jgi:hypothetical protein
MTRGKREMGYRNSWLRSSLFISNTAAALAGCPRGRERESRQETEHHVRKQRESKIQRIENETGTHNLLLSGQRWDQF